MISLHDLKDYGSPWSIWVPLTASQTLTTHATPKALPQAHGGLQKTSLGDRTVILGFAYEFVAAAGNGFDLVSNSALFSPGGNTAITIFGARASTAITRVALSVPQCFIPLDGGSISPTFTLPASLAVVCTGTPPTSGRLLIWGAVMPSSEWLLANRYFGSPLSTS